MTLGDRFLHFAWRFVADMKTIWSIFGIDPEDEERCPFCNCTRLNRTKEHHKTWSRDLRSPLLPLSSREVVPCMLHARLRIVDEFMHLLTARLKDDGRVPAIQETMDKLRVPFAIYEESKTKWRISSFNGNQAQRILDNIEVLCRLWPPCESISYHLLTVKELQALCRNDRLSIKNPTAPGNLRKHGLVSLLQQHHYQQSSSSSHTDDCVYLWTTIAGMYKAVADGPADNPLWDSWEQTAVNVKTVYDKLHQGYEMRVRCLSLS
jgi:hypothetical protein